MRCTHIPERMLALITAVSATVLLVVGCSGSNSNGINDAENPAEAIIANDVAADNAAEGAADEDTATPDEIITDSDGQDPVSVNTTRIDFEITVPAYQSDELQVQLVWGDETLLANWVGNELWSVSAVFPTDTEHLLSVTFHDGNGAIFLASYEQLFKTGSNAMQIYTLRSDQFDSDRWDSDQDGVSNIKELIAGTYTLESPEVLLFSETQGYRHDSISDALLALESVAQSAGIRTVRASDSSGRFTETELARFDAVVWVMTSGDVLNPAEQTAFENYIRAGGGYAGIHAASDTEYDWPWYGELVGAYFDRHPEIQSATQIVEQSNHPSTSHLNPTWTRVDEWYDYRSNPRVQVNVLLRLDESSYAGGGMGDDHPSAWYHGFDGGRSWYTGGGHTSASYSEPEFRTHLLGGLRYVVGF